MFYGYRQFHYIQKNQIFIKTLQKISKTRFQNQNYELDRSLSKRKDKKSIGLIQMNYVEKS